MAPSSSLSTTGRRLSARGDELPSSSTPRVDSTQGQSFQAIRKAWLAVANRLHPSEHPLITAVRNRVMGATATCPPRPDFVRFDTKQALSAPRASHQPSGHVPLAEQLVRLFSTSFRGQRFRKTMAAVGSVNRPILLAQAKRLQRMIHQLSATVGQFEEDIARALSGGTIADRSREQHSPRDQPPCPAQPRQHAQRPRQQQQQGQHETDRNTAATAQSTAGKTVACPAGQQAPPPVLSTHAVPTPVAASAMPSPSTVLPTPPALPSPARMQSQTADIGTTPSTALAPVIPACTDEAAPVTPASPDPMPSPSVTASAPPAPVLPTPALPPPVGAVTVCDATPTPATPARTDQADNSILLAHRLMALNAALAANRRRARAAMWSVRRNREHQFDLSDLQYLEATDLMRRPDGSGYTVFTLAVSRGRRDIMGYYLNRDAVNVNHTDLDGYTPLQTAAYFGHAYIVQWLLVNGAQAAYANEHGTACDVARQAGKLEVAKYLEDVTRGPQPRPTSASQASLTPS